MFREQRVEAVMDGKWISGVIDRLHVRDGGKIMEIIDFKTDRVETREELTKLYGDQMKAYETAMAAIYPDAEVRSVLVSTALRALV